MRLLLLMLLSVGLFLSLLAPMTLPKWRRTDCPPPGPATKPTPTISTAVTAPATPTSQAQAYQIMETLRATPIAFSAKAIMLAP